MYIHRGADKLLFPIVRRVYGISLVGRLCLINSADRLMQMKYRTEHQLLEAEINMYSILLLLKYPFLLFTSFLQGNYCSGLPDNTPIQSISRIRFSIIFVH